MYVRTYVRIVRMDRWTDGRQGRKIVYACHGVTCHGVTCLGMVCASVWIVCCVWCVGSEDMSSENMTKICLLSRI